MISNSSGAIIPCSIAAFINMHSHESRTVNAASGALLFAKNSLNESNEFSNLLYSVLPGLNPALH